MGGERKGLWVDIGGVPYALASGMVEAVTNPPPGFVSRHDFARTDVASRVNSIDWFARCGEAPSLDLSMPVRPVTTWPEAVEACKDPAWESAGLEAQNQLTLWLHQNDNDNYQRWNEIVDAHKEAVVNPLTEKSIAPFQREHGLDIALVQCVQWDILGALMANSYFNNNHRAFFFLELLTVYEAGHFPCGWEGEWPQGRLLVH